MFSTRLAQPVCVFPLWDRVKVWRSYWKTVSRNYLLVLRKKGVLFMRGKNCTDKLRSTNELGSKLMTYQVDRERKKKKLLKGWVVEFRRIEKIGWESIKAESVCAGNGSCLFFIILLWCHRIPISENCRLPADLFVCLGQLTQVDAHASTGYLSCLLLLSFNDPCLSFFYYNLLLTSFLPCWLWENRRNSLASKSDNARYYSCLTQLAIYPQNK